MILKGYTEIFSLKQVIFLVLVRYRLNYFTHLIQLGKLESYYQ